MKLRELYKKDQKDYSRTVGLTLGINIGQIWRNNRHLLPNRKHPGDDDGLVPLESTKVEGMSDFIVLPVSHTDMRDDEKTYAQILNFLKEGKFDHEAAQK